MKNLAGNYSARSVKTAMSVFVVLAALVLFSTQALCQDVSAPDTDDPEALGRSLMEHRTAEAKAKAARLAIRLATDPQKTANQELYDVGHYLLDLDLDPTTQVLTGTVTMTAEVLSGPLSEAELHFDSGMTTDSATAAGAAAAFSHLSGIVTVGLDRSYATGETFVVSVTYHGNPAGAAFGWSSYSGEHLIWTLSEPFGAREWWPCKDLNSDKADSVDIVVTVPDNLTVASNGLVVSDVDNGTTRTTHWKSNYPIATYLVSLAIHPYTTFSHWYTPQAGGDDMEIQYFVYPDLYDLVQDNYALTPLMIDVFSQSFGEYPFVNEKYGHAGFPINGGMEHQTLTSLGPYSEDLISHELAHQWWGDMITCDDFHHIWLNEGFATWSEAWWKEQTVGVETYRLYMEIAAFYGGGSIYVEDTSNVGAIFSSNLSYNKGSWIVHMLRGVVGDTDFFAGLDAYRAAYEYGSATTEQFRDIMEAVSGLDLDAFFQQWIYGEYFPIYKGDWSQDGDNVLLTIEQLQDNTGLFTMPVDVRIVTTTGTFDFTVDNSLASESYAMAVTGEVMSVQLDPDDWILCQIHSTVTEPTFDEGILLVNGVAWEIYGSDITSAYEDSIFGGDNPVSFWDCFYEPAAGYPAGLPPVLGHGEVPADIIGKYSTVIWIGNNYNGDLGSWQETPILSYLEAGGNVVLISRQSNSFLEGDLAAYLGVTFTDFGNTLEDCTAVYSGLVDIPFTGIQTYNDVYSTTVGAESDLLFTDTSGFAGTRGTGVYAHPSVGGTHREDGGKFVHICGRGYRMGHTALRQNMEFILENLFDEPYEPTSPVHPAPSARTLSLGRNYPNPFNPMTVIPFSLPQDSQVELAVYDAAGRLVRTLVSETRPAGDNTAVWDGCDARGRAMASGTYFARMKARSEIQVQPLALVR